MIANCCSQRAHQRPLFRAELRVWNKVGRAPKGKVVLAEFGWGGQLMPSFPGWLIKNTAPSRLAWAFKRHALPWFYWHIMLPGRSW